MEESNSKTKEEPLKKCFVIMPISDVEGILRGILIECINIS